MQVGVGRKTGFEDWTRPAKVSPGGSLPALLSFMPKLLLSLSLLSRADIWRNIVTV